MRDGRFRLYGNVALVTGGSRGIGRAIAATLAEAGADVAMATALYLAAPASSFVTGQITYVDGGYSAC